ncbi:MAG TPA: DHHA1 domain-containing protein [Thermoplasmata archaeon]
MVGSVTLPDEFSDSLKHALKIVNSAELLRVISHHDADGLAAAAVVARALDRAKKQFHLTITKGLDRDLVESLAKEGNEAILFLDMGSGQLDALETLDAKIAVLDHHKPLRKSRKIVQANPHFFGIDGMTESCSSALGFLMAVMLDPCNWDLSPIAVAGIIGDRQHMGGMKGVNQQILDYAVEREFISVQRGLNLKGASIADAIADSVDPYFVGLSGRKENALAFLESMKLNPSSPIGALDEVYRRKLTSMLSLRLMGQGCRPETVEELVAELHWIPSMSMSAADLSDLLNACGRMDHEGLGIALCMGDTDALELAGDLRREYNRKLIEKLQGIETEGVSQMDHIQFFESSDASLSGAQCGLAMQYILDQSKPTLALSDVKGKVKVSSRGTKHLVSRGLDLAAALKKAAEKVGGVGGGHAVAAGATVDAGKKSEFLASVDEIVGHQLR